MAETVYLELDDVLAIASEVLKLEANVLLHVTDVGLADSAVGRPQAGFAGQEFHPAPETKNRDLPCGCAAVVHNNCPASCGGYGTTSPTILRTRRAEQQPEHVSMQPSVTE